MRKKRYMSEQIPEVEESTKFNFITSIWIVPFIALIIAGWLAYQYYAELGPQIKIIFPTNEGLKAGQSQIKYKDVPIGIVEKITLEENGHGVVVIARMDNAAKPFLNENSKFWIVKPEFSLSGVSGLDTLVSGNYIGVFGKKGGEFRDEFIGLDHSFRNNLGGGKYYVLKTPRGDSSVRSGTPVYFKNIRVGQVEYVVLGEHNVFVEVIIFIDKQFTSFVNTDSKFWVRSTIDAELQNGALDVTVAPLTDLLNGAIEFSSPGQNTNRTVPNNFTFILHKNKNSVNSKKIGNAKKQIELFMLHTQDSIAKLKIGSSVNYDGFKVGTVIQIALSYEKTTHEMNGEILVEIDTSVFEDPNDSDHTGKDNLYQAVKEGMRAQIVPSDPITGMLYVNLTFNNSDENKTIVQNGKYALFPTVSYDSGNIMVSAAKILDKINKLPLEKLVESLNKIVNDTAEPIANANDLLIDLKRTAEYFNTMVSKKTFVTMPDEVDKALKELTRTLKTTKKVVKSYDSNSILNKQLSQTLEILTKTSKEMQIFLRMLNRKPNSLIFGDN
jgi:paraquat-inducible protein B